MFLQPIWTNAPTRLSGDWFGSEERDIATTVGAMSNPIGNAVGAVIPGLIIFSTRDVDSWMLYQAIASTVVLLITVIASRDEPLTPPSASAEERVAARAALEAAAVELRASRRLLLTQTGAEFTHEHHLAHASSASEAIRHLKIDTIAMLKNRNFVILSFGFGVGLGMFNALITIIEQIVSPCGYDSELAALAGGALLLSGLVGAGIFSVLMEKTKQYSTLQKICVSFACGAMLFMLGSLEPGQSTQVIASFGLLGFFLIPLLPINLESAAEVTYPVPEDNSAAIILSLGQVFGIVRFAATKHICFTLAYQSNCHFLPTVASTLCQIYTFILPVLLGTGRSVDCSSVFTGFAGFVSIKNPDTILLFLELRVTSIFIHSLLIDRGKYGVRSRVHDDF